MSRTILYSFTLLLSALLLFFIQPMVGKMLLPYLGGTPAVWNVCLLFFQSTLLFGYLYAHGLSQLKIRTQIFIHLGLMLLPLFLLPIGIPESITNFIPQFGTPAYWLLLVLLLYVGLPFFVVSASAPILQRWFSLSQDAKAKDPYSLYAASNLGSISGLILFPLLAEPKLNLSEQGNLWKILYWILIFLFVAVALWLLKENKTVKSNPIEKPDLDIKATKWNQRGLWLFFAFIPSSLMLGVTTYMTTDIAAIPLFWVVPLALYLISFILVFSYWPETLHKFFAVLMPIALSTSIFLLVANEGMQRLWVTAAVFLTTLFIVCLVAHGQLARSRPEVRHLTEFYLWMSLGGVLGGIFNALLAPLLFNSVFELPLILAFSGLLFSITSPKVYRWSLGAALAISFSLAATYLVLHYGLEASEQTIKKVSYGVPIVLILLWYVRPLYFVATGIAIYLIFSVTTKDADSIFQKRNFYDVVKINSFEEGWLHSLVHGGTVHGSQRRDSTENLQIPLSYYHPTGPLGDIIDLIKTLDKKRVAAVGLGTGAIAAYADTSWRLVFYELNPVMEQIALDKKYFTYLSDCKDRRCDLAVVLGDGRLSLSKSKEVFDLIVLDAFSSASIPIHLLTLEALQIYLNKLSPDGLVAFHISNYHLNLETVLYRLSKQLGLSARIRNDFNPELNEEKEVSTWVVMSRNEDSLFVLDTNIEWTLLQADPDAPLWTDTHSDIIRVIQWE